MKSLKLLLTSVFTIFLGGVAIAQNQGNTVPQEGNVGIGTTTPEFKLEVNGTARIDSSLIVKDSSTFEKPVHVKDKTTIDGKVVMKDNAVVRENFRVKGNAFLEGNFKLLSEQDSLATPLEFLLIKPNGKVERGGIAKVLELAYAIPFPLDLNLCNEDENGNIIHENPIWRHKPEVLYTRLNCPESEIRVGIGNSDPIARLHITTLTDNNYPALIINNESRSILKLENNGLLRAREIRVDLQTWPDYVFEQDYSLMSLKDLEKYINTHKHLPNVSSQATILKEGVNLGEMEKVLMEKTEELTLYVIELNKQLQEQQKVIEEQQKLLKELLSK